jgi:hypothetical protein
MRAGPETHEGPARFKSESPNGPGVYWLAAVAPGPFS